MILKFITFALVYVANLTVSLSVCDKDQVYKELSLIGKSPLTANDYQRVIHYLESQNCIGDETREGQKLYEENLYYLGLNKMMGNEGLEAIQVFQKITKTHWKDLSSTRLDDLNLKYGIVLPKELESLPITEKIVHSPYSKNFRLEFINHLLYEIEHLDNESAIIFNAQQIVESYQIILDKYRKFLSLSERVDMYGRISMLQTLVLTNSKASLKSLKQCYDLDMDNKICNSFLKAQNKLNKIYKQVDAASYFESDFDEKWATSFIKLMENPKKPLIADIMKNLPGSLLAVYPEFKKFFKHNTDLPLVKNLFVLSTIAHDTQSILQKSQKSHAESAYLKKLIDIKKPYGLEELNTLWEEVSPHIAMKILMKMDIKQAQKFLKEKENTWDEQVHNQKSPWFHKNLNVLHAKLAKIVQQEQAQQHEYFRRFQQQQQNQFRGGHFQGGNGRHHQQQDQQPQSGMNTEKDYYKILGIDKGASSKEIRSAYLKLIKQNHPDKQKNQEDKEKVEKIVHDINEAYEVLNDESLKNEYDQARNNRGRRFF